MQQGHCKKVLPKEFERNKKE